MNEGGGLGGGALQQRTTYLISLTLVKVEAVDENGGAGEAKSGTNGQGKEVDPGLGVENRAEGETRPEGKARQADGEALPKAENGSGGVLGSGDEAKGVLGEPQCSAGLLGQPQQLSAGPGDGSVTVLGQPQSPQGFLEPVDGVKGVVEQSQRPGDGSGGALEPADGVKRATGTPQRSVGPSVVAKDIKLTDELKQDDERKPLSPLKDKPPINLSIPLHVDRSSNQRTKSAEFDLTPIERLISNSESKQSRSPSLIGTPSPTTTMMEVVLEPNRTPTRTSLPMRPVMGQRPVSLLKSHTNSVATRGRDSRDGRERSPTSAQSLDRKDCRVSTRSPGPCRASWAEASRTEAWRDPRDDNQAGIDIIGMGGGGGGAVMRDMPRKDRLKAGSASLPAPITQPGANAKGRKGKSRTLDNSDLNSLSEDLGHQHQQQQQHRGSAKDRKMLKFISGIFTKSSSNSSSSTPPPVFIQRDSSEEEVNIANSQEWTLSRTIPELRLGILGSVKSGKSALVNKYITGSYVALEKADAGRYKKEVLVDGQSHLLLIREETGPPDTQFSSWVDAVILVFSLENEASFQELYQLYSQLNALRPDIPVIVVGTQDKISGANPRVIEDQRARQLCIDVRHSLFYETCATYGFNVDRVFAEAAQKIVAQKKQAALQACKSLPNSPSHSGGSTPGSASFPGQSSNGPGPFASLPCTPVVGRRDLRVAPGSEGGRSLKSIPRRPSLFKNRDSDKKSGDAKGDQSNTRGVPIKQSILWKRSGSSLNKEWKKKYVTLSNNGTLSYHSSSNDYTQNTHGKDIDLLRVTVKVPGKRPPRAVTPAGPVTPVTPGNAPGNAPGVNGISKEANENTSTVPVLCPSTLSVVDDRSGALSPSAEKGLQRVPSSLSTKAQSVDALEGAVSPFSGKDGQSSPMSDRKKHRRKKSMNQKGDAAVGQAEAKRKMWKLKSFGSLRNINKTDEENADFIVVSFTGQSWHFEAQSLEDRDSWVSAIESQILHSLQSCESGRNKARRSSQSEAVALQAIRNTKGNGLCVDCEAQNPTWASLNLGALICIECSGIHRNLGTHLSRVRSLDLDDWPGELTQVLAAIGNSLANSIWERCTQGRTKPTPNATREERESWIRAKYEQRLFVASLPPVPGHLQADNGMPALLLAAVTERDLPRLLLLLAHSTKEQMNAVVTSPGAPPPLRTALHAACQLGDVVMTQLLVWYGIDLRAKDGQGQTAMRLARRSGSKGCADILLQHGVPNEAMPPIPASAAATPPPSSATPVLSRRSSTASLGRRKNNAS